MLAGIAFPGAGTSKASSAGLPAYGMNNLKAEALAGQGGGAGVDWNGLADLSLTGSHRMGLYRARFRQDVVAPQGAPADWTQLDNLVRQAALRRVTILPVLINMPGEAYTPPRSPGARTAFASFAAAAVRRYGPDGALWSVCGCPKLPIKVWEVWSEENVAPYWSPPDPGQYGLLLRSVRGALRSVDPSARILFGGLADLGGPGTSGRPAAEFLKGTIQGVGPDAFDALAMHVYQPDPDAAVRALESGVEALKASGGTLAGGAPRHQVWVTELGRPTDVDDLRTPAADEQSASEASQSRWLSSVMDRLDSRRAAWSLGPVLWYAMRDVPTSFLYRLGVQRTGSDERLGLRRTSPDDSDAGPKPAWEEYALRAAAAGSVALPSISGTTTGGSKKSTSFSGVKITSKRKTRRTLRFRLSGKVKRSSSTGARCSGKVGISVRSGSKRVEKASASVKSSCRWSKTVVVSRSKLPRSQRRRLAQHKKITLKVSYRYRGSSSLKGSSTKSKKVSFR